MPYVPSMREIPLDQEPHASVLASLSATITEETEFLVAWEEATDEELAHVLACSQCAALLGYSDSITIGLADVQEVG